MDVDFTNIPAGDRELIARWAIKTARTEEWTGQQVLRLLPSIGGEDQKRVVALHAQDEFRHAQLYASLADDVAGHAGWGVLRSYVSSRNNFRDAEFTSIFRVMDSIPMCLPPGRDGGSDLVRFYMALFYLDLAGLMTVNVYDEAPYADLQRIALEVREDESRHVHLGRDYLIGKSHVSHHEQVQKAALEMLPHIEKFFGGDESATQKALKRHGFRNTPNKELFGRFKAKVTALLRVELPA